MHNDGFSKIYLSYAIWISFWSRIQPHTDHKNNFSYFHGRSLHELWGWNWIWISAHINGKLEVHFLSDGGLQNVTKDRVWRRVNSHILHIWTVCTPRVWTICVDLRTWNTEKDGKHSITIKKHKIFSGEILKQMRKQDRKWLFTPLWTWSLVTFFKSPSERKGTASLTFMPAKIQIQFQI